MSFCCKWCSILLLFLPLPFQFRTILMSAGNSNGFTTRLKLKPYIQNHVYSPIHQSLFLAWEVLEHEPKKCGFNWWWSLITKCWNSYKVWEILEHTRMNVTVQTVAEHSLRLWGRHKLLVSDPPQREICWYCWCIWQNLMLIWVHFDSVSGKTKLFFFFTDNIPLCYQTKGK
jgi:hypothetical protein